MQRIYNLTKKEEENGHRRVQCGEDRRVSRRYFTTVTENSGRKQYQKGKYLGFEGATKHPIANELRIGKRLTREADFESSAFGTFLTTHKKSPS